MVVATVLVPAPPAEATDPVKTPNIDHVVNVQYPIESYPTGTPFNYEGSGGDRQGGTDLETTTITVDHDQDGIATPRDFAVAGSYRNGLQLVDVTDPTAPALAQTYDCGMAQGDVQVFVREGRTYAAYAQDDIPGHANYTTACFQDALALEGYGTPMAPGDAEAIEGYGTLIVDITNPYATAGPDRVRVVGWARELDGSHNATVDPSGMWLYNSNQDLLPKTPVNGQSAYRIEVFSLADLGNPTKVFELPLSTGTGPHDITFSDDGTRAYVAAISHTVVLDTTDPSVPSVIGVIEDPSISIHHQSDPIDIGGRRLLVIADELIGVIEGSAACPGGGLHIYDVTGSLERTPVKVGYFAIPQVAPPGQDHRRCTAHVFKAYPDQGLMTIAWYGAGVRVLDISNLAGVSAGVEPGVVGSVGNGIQEVGSFFFEQTDTQVGSQTWSAKVHHFEADGSAYIFANDLDRGFDVFYYDATAPTAADAGTWLAPENVILTVGAPNLAAARALPFCVIPPDGLRG